jgi:hypothetical protein
VKERYAYIILVLINVGLSCSLIFVFLYELKSNDQKFCQVVKSVTVVPAIRPINPAKDPSREKTWEHYRNFVDLGRSLGCPGMPTVKEVP